MNSRLHDLEILRDSLGQRLSRYHQHQRRAGGPLDPDFAEQASETQNDEVVDILESEVRDQLARVDHAIERIHAGVGDICALPGNHFRSQTPGIAGNHTLRRLRQRAGITACCGETAATVSDG